jgi:hypothetical protein
LSDSWQTISLQKCIQIADSFSLFLLHKCLLRTCKRKSLKTSKNFRPIPSEQKCLCRPIADLKQTIGLSGRALIYCSSSIYIHGNIPGSMGIYYLIRFNFREGSVLLLNLKLLLNSRKENQLDWIRFQTSTKRNFWLELTLFFFIGKSVYQHEIAST